MAIGHNPNAGITAGRKAASSRRGVHARFTEEDLSAHFDNVRMVRARTLAATGMVKLEEPKPGQKLRAVVADGTSRHQVQLSVGEERGGVVIRPACSCRGAACVHAAAAALAFLEAYPDLRRPVQSSFLERLSTAEAPQEERRVIYGLEAQARDDGLYVTVANEIVCGPKRRIESSSPKRAAVAAPVGPDGDHDRAVCRLLNMSSLPLVAVPLDDDELIEELITALLDTGRVRWGLNGPALVRGTTKRFLRETNPRTGASKFLNKPLKVKVLGSDPAWYINEVTGQIGAAVIDEVTPRASCRPPLLRATCRALPASRRYWSARRCRFWWLPRAVPKPSPVARPSTC